MPNPPIILPIAPSNWQRASDVGLCASGIVLAVWHLEFVAVLGAASLVLVFWGWRVLCGWRWRQPLIRTLWVVEHEGSVQSHWIYASGEVSHTRTLRCDYLGPRLLRLNVGGERLWLWPDSAPVDAQRQLRRLLLYIPQR
ncbi:hypothetical protein QC823_06225 [Halomonas vilamensis]|uniref:Toxin CptA n=1 Tax=Vreelandella vilamensis TaxID=531309 RepID=A0ABU1H2R3_9GAMM|nr:hypothetical protein [Halomonas vilamensis]MDR5898579.1 hypothetical protein [Halomonas vilamensis]